MVMMPNIKRDPASDRAVFVNWPHPDSENVSMTVDHLKAQFNDALVSPDTVEAVDACVVRAVFDRPFSEPGTQCFVI